MEMHVYKNKNDDYQSSLNISKFKQRKGIESLKNYGTSVKYTL